MFKSAIERGGVAVITGGALGVGRAAAKRFVDMGLDLVLADTNEEALHLAVEELQEFSRDSQTIKGIVTDVSNESDINALADQCFELGEIAILMNNAGVGIPTKSWENADGWRRNIEINLFGVINGVQAFLPRMVDANRPAVVINTGSKQGITTPPGNPAYNVTKAGVKVLSEMLAHDLREAEVPITVHLFVPGFTYTNMIQRFMPEKPDAAWTSEETVDYFIESMSEGDFYILCPDNDVSQERDKKRVEWAVGDILENRPALSRWHPDYAQAFLDHENG